MKNFLKWAWLAQLFLLAALACITMASAGTDGSVADSAFLSISLVNQQPDPVSPGEALELRFKVENRGTAPAMDVSVQLVDKFPISINSGEQTKEIGTISGRQKEKDAVTVRFLVTVNPSAGHGVNPIALRYKTASQDWATINSFNITIGQRDLPLTIPAVRANPETVAPGSKSTLSIEVANKGASAALNVRVKLNLTDSIPVFTYGTTNERFIQRINPGESTKADFELVSSPSAKSSIYRIPFIVTYLDATGKNYTVSGQSFSIQIGSKPQIAASATGTEAIKLKKREKVTVEIINTGLTDVKFLTAKLAARQEEYEVLSPESVYIGSLDSGDSETASYDVYFVKKSPLLLDVEYSDALNNNHSQRIEVPVRVFTGPEINRFGLENKSGNGVIVILSIVATGIVAYAALRRKRKHGT